MNINKQLKKLAIVYLLLVMISGCKSDDKSTNQRDSLFLILLNSQRTEPSAPKDCSVLMGGSIQTCGKDLSLKGLVSTIAGTGSAGNADGTGTAAGFTGPVGITSDGTNLYVADTFNNKIRKIVISTGVVSTLAGSGAGGTDGTGTAARFTTPFGITTDGTNLYVADTGNEKIRKIVISTGVVSTLAGSGVAGSADGTGTAATFEGPMGITTDGTNLYVAAIQGHNIRKIVISSGVVTTLAGGSGISGFSDGTGTAARFNNPLSITTDGNNLYITDQSNYRIRKIEIKTGVVTTIAGSGNNTYLDGTGSAAGFVTPSGIITDGINLYISELSPSNRIRKIVIATGLVTTLAGSGSSGFANGTGTSATFLTPRQLTTDGKFLYVTDAGNHSVRKIE